jgi:signal transduction histidine kinase
VTGVLMLASADLETRNVIVKSDLPDHPLIVKIDADLIKQALLNVVLNGAQAMAEGGELEVRMAEDGRMALLSVHDQGSGIPPELLDKIFDLYFTTKKDGSGIGLAMTYRIMELHNGSIEVKSDAVHGTTFLLRLPLSSTADNRLRGYLMPDGSEAVRTIVAKEPRG